MAVEFGGTVESSGMRVNPADVLDINKVWPGKERNAWLTEQIAYVIWNQAIKHCDYIVDMHDGTGACDELPVAFPHAFPPEGKPPLAGGVADGTGSEISFEENRPHAGADGRHQPPDRGHGQGRSAPASFGGGRTPSIRPCFRASARCTGSFPWWSRRAAPAPWTTASTTGRSAC